MTTATDRAVASSALHLPPYGRKILSLRAQGLAPSIALLVIDGWGAVENLADYAPWLVVIPDGDPARGFDFRFTAGLFVVVWAETLVRVDELAQQVARFHPKQIFGRPEHLGRIIAFKREGA